MTTRNSFTQLVALITFALSLSGCPSGGSSGDSGPITVAITNPGGVDEIQTPDFIVSLTGTAKSVVDIERVTWVNDRGGRGSANGKENWATGNIVLMLGVNNIMITATDADGNESSKGIAVDRENNKPGANSVAESILMYSYASGLSNPAPVEGATLRAGPIYFFMEPGADWLDRNLSQVDYQCCKGISGPGAGDAFGQTMPANTKPWTQAMDLTGLQPGGTRRIRAVGHFADGSASEARTFDFVVAAAASSNNRTPTISGNAPNSAVVATNYSFQPTARDADGDSLSFTITKKPSWATFDKKTGLLQGTPGGGHIGRYDGITISVSDGKSSASLGPFAVVVNPSAAGNATLSWQPPMLRMDNTSLGNDLAGYRIHYGQSPRSYSNQINVNNAGLSTYVVENLSSGTWYFAVTAKDKSGQFSAWSNEGQIRIP